MSEGLDQLGLWSQRGPSTPQQGEELVQQAALRIENPDPEDAGRHHRDDRRQVEERPPDGDAANLDVQEHGHRQADDHPHRHADDHVERVPQGRRHEVVAGEHPGVVVQADEARRVEDVVVAETDEKRKEHRAAAENDKPDDPRRRAHEAPDPLAPEHPAARSLHHGIRVLAHPERRSHTPPERKPRVPEIDGHAQRRQQRDIADEEPEPREERPLGRREHAVQVALDDGRRLVQGLPGPHRMVEGRIGGADLLVPEELPDGRDRPIARLGQQIVEHPHAVLELLGDSRTGVDVLLEEPLVRAPLRGLAGDEQLALRLADLAAALGHDHLGPLAHQELDELPAGVLVMGRRRDGKAPAAAPRHARAAAGHLALGYGHRSDRKVRLRAEGRQPPENPEPVNLHRDLALDERVQFPALEPRLEPVDGVVAAHRVVDVHRPLERLDDLRVVHRAPAAVGAHELAAVHPGEHVEPRVAEERGKAEHLQATAVVVLRQADGVRFQFVPVARRPRFALLVHEARTSRSLL